jgi:hypothetical protein
LIGTSGFLQKCVSSLFKQISHSNIGTSCFTPLNTKLLTKHEILSKLENYINRDGEILQTSGDTYGVNRYSATFGKSELSQGMLLLLLANAKD